MTLCVITKQSYTLPPTQSFMRTKHIEVDCHFIREKIASECMTTSFVNSSDQLADCEEKNNSLIFID